MSGPAGVALRDAEVADVGMVAVLVRDGVVVALAGPAAVSVRTTWIGGRRTWDST